MTRLPYVVRDGVWKRYGWPDVESDVVAPYLTRAPSLAGPTSSEASLTLDAGVKAIPAGGVYRHMLLSGRIASVGTGAVIEDVIIDIPASSSDVHGITQWAANVRNVRVKDVLIRCREVNRSFWIGSGIHGSGIQALGVRFEGLTDAFTMAGVNQVEDVEAAGCWVTELMKYADDGYSIGRPGAHIDGSHPDGFPVEGGTKTARIRNTRIGVRAGTTSGVIVTENAGTFLTGPELDGVVFEIEDGSTSFGTLVNLAKSSMTSVGTSAIRNCVFPDGSSPARMYIRPEYLTAIKASGGLVATGPGANRYASGTPGSPVVPVYNGTTNLTDY